jgi:hypothetical protein
MMTPDIALAAAAAQLVSPVKNKRVLLVDTCRPKRDLRAEAMRRLGLEVDCAADVLEARCWWRPDLYNLVLFNVDGDFSDLARFCQDIRGATPAQAVAFLVGKPEYLASTMDGQAPVATVVVDAVPQVSAMLASANASAAPQIWGIMEACRRIALVRFNADTRSRSLRERPLPPRDPEKHDRRRPNAALDAELEFGPGFDRAAHAPAERPREPQW